MHTHTHTHTHTTHKQTNTGLVSLQSVQFFKTWWVILDIHFWSLHLWHHHLAASHTVLIYNDTWTLGALSLLSKILAHTCISNDHLLWSSQMKEKSFIIQIPTNNIQTHLVLLILTHHTLWYWVQDPHILNILVYNFCDALRQCIFYTDYKIHLNLASSNILTGLPEDGHVGRTMLEYNKIQMW